MHIKWTPSVAFRGLCHPVTILPNFLPKQVTLSQHSLWSFCNGSCVAGLTAATEQCYWLLNLFNEVNTTPAPQAQQFR